MGSLYEPDVMEAISQIADCVTEAEANALVKDIVQMLGGTSFVYSTLLPPDYEKNNEGFQFFIGCSPEFCDIYNRRMWMMNDPFVEYARSHTAPIVGSKIKILTAGQAELLRTGADYGFRSGLVVPTHTSMEASKRMGMLYIGSELPPEIGEPLLLRKRVQFGALGMELLLWWSDRLRTQAMRKFSLLDDDIELLRLAKKGKVAWEIAALYDMKLAAVYKRLNNIKEKFDVDKIEHAVREAEAHGIIS